MHLVKDSKKKKTMQIHLNPSPSSFIIFLTVVLNFVVVYEILLAPGKNPAGAYASCTHPANYVSTYIVRWYTRV